jgi:hypothetical protein
LTKYSACEACPAARAAFVDTHGTGHTAHAYEGEGIWTLRKRMPRIGAKLKDAKLPKTSLLTQHLEKFSSHLKFDKGRRKQIFAKILKMSTEGKESV